MSNNFELYLRPLPCLDSKWLKADLISSLRNPEDTANLWNNLIQDCELVSSSAAAPTLNSDGNMSYLGDDGKHYCGAVKLKCVCCQGYCGPLTLCNCQSCNLLDSDVAIKKTLNSNQNQINEKTSESIIESWIWGSVPNKEEKEHCIQTLLTEQHEISLQGAANCLSSSLLKQHLYIYERYFIALARTKKKINLNSKNINDSTTEPTNCKFPTEHNFNPLTVSEINEKKYEKATLGLARVGTRAALNFSFAFLRRAWRSGEDTELCAELLGEALESLQELPEASLFETNQMSPLWIEVLERSVKFLRQVVLEDVVNSRGALPPRRDRHLALNLLLELGTQKGTLGASLEGTILLLMLWEKEKATDDNRDPPQNTGAPLVRILRRYEQICNIGALQIKDFKTSASATESFLRFLSLPEQESSNIDLKQAAVVIISHLDRLAKPHMPTTPFTVNVKSDTKFENSKEQHIFGLGWLTDNDEIHGFTAESAVLISLPGYSPYYSQYKSLKLNFSINVKEIAFSQDQALLLSQENKVYLWKLNKSNIEPVLVEELSGIDTKEIASNCEGKHYLALDSAGQVYSWGSAEAGRLGHGDSIFKESPTKIAFFKDKEVVKIACGCSYSAAVTSSGELYTWGRGTLGRLGHGSSEDKLTPTLVKALQDYKVTNVSLGSGDSHSLCVTETGFVYAWGDGDFGKLGNESCNGSQIPQRVLHLPPIKKVEAGSQFSVALSFDGKVFTWGKGQNGQLGYGAMGKHIYGTSEMSNIPKVIAALESKPIIDISVGSAHVLALSQNGEVFGWGRNDYQQVCPQSISSAPIIDYPILITHPSIKATGIVCGATQSIIWCENSFVGIDTRVPFIIDLSEHTFRLLDQLIGMVCGNVQDNNTSQRSTPNQESECIAVACLNLLRLQLHSLIVNKYSPKSVGLSEGSRLLISLKTRILHLAGGNSILKTIQEAAQWTLQVGWSVLLPTASERAQTLTSLLPSDPGISSSGHRFMTDLLVGSLMAEEGLEIALNQSINSENSDAYVNSHNLPLLHLIKQLLLNNSALTQARLVQLGISSNYNINHDDDLTTNEHNSPSLDLLHRFQKLLLSHIHQSKSDEVSSGAETLLSKYIQNAIGLCIISLQKAHEVSLQRKQGIIEILRKDISDTLLYELLIGLVLIKRDKPNFLPSLEWTKTFVPLLYALDNVNRAVCNSEIEDADDMGWPAIICRGNSTTQKTSPLSEEPEIIRKCDLENHIIDGGKWIIINGYVCDVQNFKYDVSGVNDLLQNNIGKDITKELELKTSRAFLDHLVTNFKVGKFGIDEINEKTHLFENKSLTYFKSERVLTFLLGMKCFMLQCGLPLQPAEIQCKNLLTSEILSGGLRTLQPSNPFDEEKGEARSSSSTAGNSPTESTIQSIPEHGFSNNLSSWPHNIIVQRVESLLNGLSEAKISEPLVSAWISISERYAKENNLVWHQEFSVEHPIQELDRLLTAVLIRHQSLGPLILAVIDRELSGNSNSNSPPKQISEIIRLVHQTKWSIIRTRQQLNRSYKEVCAPMLERLRFLLFEVRPAISLEQIAFKNLSILHKQPRFKSLVKKIIADMRVAKKQLACAKPEDILNVTIQSQNAAQKISSQESLSFKTEPLDVIRGSSVENVSAINSPLGKNVSNENLLEIESCDLNNKTTKSPTTDLADSLNKQKEPEQFVNDVILKLSEKCLQIRNSEGDLNEKIISQIVDFVLQEVCDVETLRRAMFCQVQRYENRKRGIDMFTELLKINGLLDAAHYNLLMGYLGLYSKRFTKQYTKNIINDLNLITAYQKVDLLLCQSKIIEWAVTELQKLVNQEQPSTKNKFHGGKDNSNLGTYVFLKKLPRARFLLIIFGLLAKEIGPNELSLLVNSGVLGILLGLLKQTGTDTLLGKYSNELSTVYEDTMAKQSSSKVNLTGPELAKLMKIGTRVCRGADWKWGDQDGNPPGEGRIISEVGEDGWVRVEWDTGGMNSYRMGKEKQYDLRLAENASNMASPDAETEKDDVVYESQISAESHPTRLLRIACAKMVQLLAISLSIHSRKSEKSAVKSIVSMFRSALIMKNTSISNFCGLNTWSLLGFIRAVAGDSTILARYLTSTVWLDLYINLLDMSILSEQEIFKKIHCLRLLQVVLTNWLNDNSGKCAELVQKLFLILGKHCLYCPNDLSLAQNSIKSRILLTASHSSTISEELITLLRKLHTLPLWNSVINSFLSQKLCIAADFFTENDLEINNVEMEKIYISGVLNTIGGCDIRPRVGLQLIWDGQKSTVSGFTQKGKSLLSIKNDHNHNTEFKKISLQTALDCADYSVFSFSRLSINEMLLNSWASLLYGPGERKESIPGAVDVQLLRFQQIQLSVLNSNRVLFRHQASLRKILRQRSPGLLTYSSEESLSQQEQISNNDLPNDINSNLEDIQAVEAPLSNGELLIQSILIRAIQPSPIKAIYSYQELATAALNISQMLASHIHMAVNGTLSNNSLLLPLPAQPTLIHGVPVYNNDSIKSEVVLSPSNEDNTNYHAPFCNANLNNKPKELPLISQIMEMGFTKKSIELAIDSIETQNEKQPTPEQVVQWMIEHPDLCPPIASTSKQTLGNLECLEIQEKSKIANIDSDSDSSSEDTVEGLSQEGLKKFLTRKNFQSADQYAMYVRGLVCPGMTVKCCRDFEEIKKGDIGNVLKVDTEGLHDLNVQVDWKIHGSTYWMCFVHIELLEPPKEKEISEKLIEVGSQVRIKPQISIPRYKWGLVTRGSVGIVTSINDKDVTVDFPQQENWTGCIDEMELVNFDQDNLSTAEINFVAANNDDLIDDWSRCIRSLTVSSGESTAKHLLEKGTNYWQSSSINNQSKHWIRLEIHENIIIHSLSVIVSPADCSHMPSLIVTRVGESIAALKEYSWVSVKPSDVNVPLLNDVRQYFQWIEIVVKQCRNNGIQCKIHGIKLIGRKKQTDLDLMLLNASFLASEYDNICEPNSMTSCSYPDEKTNEPTCTVMVWGLNDKEQLGGLKGSKIKIPTFSQTLSRLRPIHIAGGSKSLFIVSEDGKVYACGEGTNGRLGLGHNCNISAPRQVPVLHQYVVKKVAVHSGGKHCLALTLDGKIFSWGEGEDGKLGHGNRLTLDKPKLIDALRSKKVRDIACGSSHSAAITSSGELYTWGLGEYGRLGHGDNCSQLKPKLVTVLLGKRVVQVACGSRDAQTLALTEDGLVYSWGDGDFGKLGRGGSEGSSIPHEVERLTGIGVMQIECGAQFSLALTKTGEVWTWGKGDYFRLGQGTDAHVRKPAVIQGLRGKKVIHVAVGALHCLAVTDSGQVYAWGDNDHGQQGSGNTVVNKKPAPVIGLDSVFVNRVACGSSHSVAWGLPQSPLEDDKKGPVPFATTKDPLGGSSLGIYDSEINTNSNKQSGKISLSETLLSLETYGARQTALNYVLNAMSILQARQIIVSALTSHSQVVEKLSPDFDANNENSKDFGKQTNNNIHNINGNNEIIAHGGGEAPAEFSEAPINEASSIEKSIDIEMTPAPAGPISALQSLTGSSSLSASISSNAPQRHSKMSASAMSVMAATMPEMVVENSLTGLDDFSSLLGESEAKNLVELLKLSVAGRASTQQATQTIAETLIALGSNSSIIGAMLLETCITELEDLCISRHCLGKVPKPIVQETSHPYIDDISLVGHVKIPGAEALRLEFDPQCSTEKRNDPLVIMDGAGRVIATRSGRESIQWTPEIRVQGDEMRWKFTSDSSVNGWGFRFWVHAIMPASFMQEQGSDRAILSQPSMPLVMALLDSRLGITNQVVLLRLAAALSTCAQINSLTTSQRIWSLKKLHSIIMSKHAPKPLDPALNPILMPLIPELLRQYEYEEPQVRGGIHLIHSEYFKMLAALACDMQLDSVLPLGDMHKWTWFRRYCTAVRVAKSFIYRTELPKPFCLEVRKKLVEMIPNNDPHLISATMVNSVTSLSSSTISNPISPAISLQPQSLNTANSITPTRNNFYIESLSSLPNQENNDYKLNTDQIQLVQEDHTLFKKEHDSQLLQWLNHRPEDWALSWGGASTIYGWGHNHRGQLGGLEGSRIKTPTPCEALSLLRPIQLAGGEQTLYAVTPDGKLFATGYGANGRLGIGGMDSVTTPTLVESLQHVFVKKVAVNSGGKHCLVLTTDGEVYSFGEGEDGKLGHGNRNSYDRPTLIEGLSGIGIIDIACGSAHSACITSSGHVLTWGKGRYGRLGHGDSEDQLRPKLVESLLGYKAVDIACGSGDAQTLLITDDDNVWSWGDGDYGKLGRGGSDGCKVPMKIESLSGLGVIKVECGSQFSVALTRSGSVYTWGKGDYHRLGHGSVDHVRRPKKVASLQGKKIISIATGSLHCVACSDTGEVFTWGDNDEGQLGDGTVSAIQRPRLVVALQGKHILKVTCGSAHTLALSTCHMSEGSRTPPNPPLEYDLVRDLPPESLHARLVLLHHFSELICPCLTMLPISGDLSLEALKDLLVYTIKEATFRKVIQTTMVRDKQHGPVIELNRIQVKRSRTKSGGGLAGIDGMKSVFGQMVQKLPLLTSEALSLPHRVWKVKFVGESVDDCGGGYSESIAEMCDELQNGSVPLLINTPNGRGEAGANRDCFLLDPTLNSVLQMNMFRFLGVLMGIAIRTGSPLSLNLAEPVWRQLAGENLRPSDLTEVDRDYIAGLLCIRDMEDDTKVFNTLELPFSTSSAKGHEVLLSTRYSRITPNNREEYVRLALNYRLHEFDEQVKAVRDGMSKVIPVPLLSLFSASELQAMVCGSPDIPLTLLKSVATYKGVDPSSQLVVWFWEVMEEFTNQERSLFLRFVWGRTRLPRTIADFRGRDFVLQVLDKYNPPDHFLPESYTCFFLLKMPRYSCKAVLLEKLKYAIHFCKSIDTDEYARVAMGDPTEATASDESDLESVASHDP